MTRTVALVVLAAALLALGARLVAGPASEPASAPPAARAMPAVGQSSPRFELPDQNGVLVAVGGPSASWTIVTFYRAAGTPW